MTVLAWLFLRGAETTRVVRDPDGFVLHVEGPGYTREVHVFKTEDELVEFQRSFEARLLLEGWALGASQERRSGRERRAARRGTDRRRT